MPMLEGTLITAAGYLPYGGAINARSEDAGQGSEFLVSQPITVPSIQGDESAASVTGAAPDVGSLCILVADDLRANADSLAMQLQAVEHRVRMDLTAGQRCKYEPPAGQPGVGSSGTP